MNQPYKNDQVFKILHNLYYDIINIEFNLWPWIRNMCKYGDFFLKLDIHEKYGITNVIPLPVYDVARVEGLDPDDPTWLTTGFTITMWVKFLDKTSQGTLFNFGNPTRSENPFGFRL